MSLKGLGGEFGLIKAVCARHGRPSPAGGLKLGAGDDACVYKPTPGCDLLATCDLLVEGVHFDLATTGPWQLGAKALAASLSDVAAMGGLPRFYLVSLSIPERHNLDKGFFEALYDGMRAWGDSFGAELAGGDTTRSLGPLVIDVTLLGEAEAGAALTRGGARPGDLLYCTGDLGGSAAGLACLQRPKLRVDADARALAEKRHLLPVPRFLAGRWLLSNRAASACIDVSDGLAGEAGHIAERSGCGIEIDAAAVPMAAATRLVAKSLRKDPLEWALRGGEDYELLFTVPRASAARVEARLKNETGTEAVRIGRVVRRRGLWLRRGGRLGALRAEGYTHF